MTTHDSDRSCRFCTLRDSEDAVKYGTVYAIFDGYPVAHGHQLIIPVRHCSDVFELTAEEFLDTQRALRAIHEQLRSDGWGAFNVGWNAGVAAGQTVAHAHCHVIPRELGDVEDPVGGIRGVIPSRRNYLASTV